MIVPLLAAAVLLPPPVPGDERTEILVTLNSLVEALASSDGEAFDALTETDGSFAAVDRRDPAAIRQNVTSFADLRSTLDRDGPTMMEKLGIPTVMQRGPIAQVWVPYSFAVEGKLSHCGIDAFNLVKRDDRWRVTGLVYTVENTDKCEALAAPKIDQ